MSIDRNDKIYFYFHFGFIAKGIIIKINKKMSQAFPIIHARKVVFETGRCMRQSNNTFWALRE